MSLETDLLLDRRRLKRRLVFWRSFAVAALTIAAIALLHEAGISVGGAHLARLSVSGIIAEDRKLNQTVAKLADNPNVKAVIVAIDSPGGTVSGGESLYLTLGLVAAKKPVVAVMGGTAASAGYMVALPSARIFAHEATITGSIGVLLETGDVSGLLGKLGVSTEAITSGALKDQPSYTKPLSPQGREVLHGLVMDMYDQFVGMVAKSRKMDPDKVRFLADGRAYTGRQALALGLVDAIGGESEARAWLAANRDVPASLPIEDLSTQSLAGRTLFGSLSPVLDGMWKTLTSQSVRLDGAWAIWHRSGG
jgi:protease-4